MTSSLLLFNMSETVQLTDWWISADPYMLLAAVLLPVLIWLTKTPLAKFLILPLASIARAFHIEITTAEKSRLIIAISAICVAAAFYISYSFLGVPGTVSQLLGAVIRIALIVTLFRFLNELLQSAIAKAAQSVGSYNVISGNWLPQFAKLVVIVLMIFVILQGWGIDLGPALTGLGIAGAAVALAAQDLLRNLIAGVSIGGERRFKVGDWVNFGGGQQGIIEKMELRSTVIRNFDGSKLFVPNSELANSVLTNFSERDARRIRWSISTTYSTSPEVLEALCDRISEFIFECDLFLKSENFHCFVKLHELKESSVDILVDCYVASNTWEAELNARHILIQEIKRIFADLNANFAFPTINVLGGQQAQP